jgi:hypothetical protein
VTTRITKLDNWTRGGSPGTELKSSGHRSIRTARDGRFGAHGVYHRYSTPQKFQAPFVWRGEIKIREVMDPPVFEDGTPAWYDPAVNFDMIYPSNDLNVFCNFARWDDHQKTSSSAEMRDERPDKPYQYRTGVASRTRERLPFDPVDGRFHDFIVVVLSTSHYAMSLDGFTFFEIQEKLPATIPPGRWPVGLRLDFCDVEFRNMTVEETTVTNPQPITPFRSNPMTLTPIEPRREIDTRGGQLRKDGTLIPDGGGRLRKGMPRRIKVVAGTSGSFTVSAFSASRPGYVTVSSDGSFSGEANAVSFAPNDVRENGMLLGAPDGCIWVKATQDCDIAVDCTAVGN